MRFLSSRRIAAWAAACAFLSTYLLVQPANAAIFTWDGGGGSDPHWDVATNWAGDVAPLLSTYSGNESDLVFGNVYTSTTIKMRAEMLTDYVRSLTFAADAPAYTIMDDWSDGSGSIYNRSVAVATNSADLPASAFITNASANQQILDCSYSFRMNSSATYGYIGINLNNAVMSGDVEIPNLRLTGVLSMNSPNAGYTSVIKVTGPGDLQIDTAIGMSTHANCDFSIDTDTQITVASGLAAYNANVTSTTFRKKGSGTIIFNGPSPTLGMIDPRGTAYQDFAQNVAIGVADSALSDLTDMGSIRLNHAGALGLAGSASGSYTQIRGATKSNGRLELANDIYVSEYIIINGRGGMNSLNPAIVNYSGNNTVEGTMIDTATDANFYNFGANNAGEKLTIANNFSVDTSGDRGVNFVGAGDGEFTGSIMGTGSNASVSLGKFGTGTLTLAGSANDRIGHILVRSGTVKLGPSAAFTFSPLARGKDAGGSDITLPSTIQVDSGTTFDASELFGGLSINATLQGNGNVLGTIVASPLGGMKVKPGDLATAHATEAASIVSLDAHVGTLPLGGLDMSTFISGTGGNPEMVWDLAALSTGNPGTDFDRIAVGSLTLGGTSTLNVNFSLLPEALRPNAAAPNAFWTANRSWKIIDAASNLSNTNFANYLNALGTTGQFSTSVGIGADAGDIFLNYTVIPYDVLTWAGGLNGNAWDNNNTANWKNGAVASKFTILDQVNFTDAGSGTVNITEDVTCGTITFNNSAKDYTLTGTGAILGGAALVKNGTGKAIIANYGANTFAGQISVNAGTLQVGDGGTAGNLGPGEIVLGPAGTVAYKRADAVSLANTLSGTGTFRHEGAGTLTLAGANADFAGTIAVASGSTIKGETASALGGAATTVNIADGGTLDVNALNLGDIHVVVKGAGVGGMGAIDNFTAVTQSNALKHVTAAGDVTFGTTGGRWGISGGMLDSSVGTYKLTKVGAYTVALRSVAVSNDLGDIDIQQANLSIENATTLGDPTKTVSIATGGTLAFYNVSNPQNKVVAANGGRFSVTGNTTFAGPVTLNADTEISVNTADQIFNLTNVVSGTGGLIKSGPGIVALSNDNNNYAGTTTITAGHLYVGNGGTTGSIGPGEVITSAGTRFYYYRSGTFAQTNLISGAGEVRYSHRDAVVTLNHDNTYTGDTYIYNGTLILKTNQGLGSGFQEGALTHGTTHIRSGTDAVRNGRLVLNPSVGVDLTIDENFTTSGSGGKPFDYNGPGIIDNLSGNNTINGSITTRTDGGPSLITVSGGSLTLAGAITNGSSQRSIVFGGTGNGTVTGAIGTEMDTNVINVEKAGTGVWTLAGGNMYTGTTTIHEGTLALSGATSIAKSSAITLRKSSAILDMSLMYDPTLYFSWSPTEGTQNLIGAGTIKGNVYAQASTNVISPSGSGSLPTNLKGGTMYITGNLTLGALENLQFKLTGNTASAQNDKITVGGDVNMSFGQTNVAIIPSTSLAAGTYTLLSANTFSNPGSFLLGAHNTRYSMSVDNTTDPKKLLLHVSGSNANLTWNGGTAGDWDVLASANWLNGGSPDAFYQADAVTFGESSAATTVTLNTIVYPASITVNSSQDYTINGTGKLTSGTGILKQGTGTLTISTTGVNDFTGGVTISGGTYKMGTATALGSNYDGSLTINGGTLDINGQALYYRSLATVQGAGAGGTGAIVNNGAARDGMGENVLAYLELAGDTTFGGSGNWALDTQSYYIFSTPYLHGNGHVLTKTGVNTVALRNMGNVNLGNVTINQGGLSLSGNTDLSSAGTLMLAAGTSNDAASLILSNSAVTFAKPMVVGGAGGAINNAAGNNTVSANATLNSPLTVLSAGGTTLAMNGNLSGSGGLTKDSAGTVVLSGNNTYQGDTTIVVGTLELSTFGQIVNSNIVNDAEFRVNGGTHTVHAITGTGSTVVLPSTTLTATSIVQNTLSIGGPAVAASAAAVPEPSALLLVFVGLIGWAGWLRYRTVC